MRLHAAFHLRLIADRVGAEAHGIAAACSLRPAGGATPSGAAGCTGAGCSGWLVRRPARDRLLAPVGELVRVLLEALRDASAEDRNAGAELLHVAATRGEQLRPG